MTTKFKLINDTPVETVLSKITALLNKREHTKKEIQVTNKQLEESYKALGIDDKPTFNVNLVGSVVYYRPVLYMSAYGDLKLRVNGKDYVANSYIPTGIHLQSQLVEFNDSGLLVKVRGLKIIPGVNPASIVNLFSSQQWLDMVGDLPPQAIDLESGFYQVEDSKDGAIKLKGYDKWYTNKDACKQPNVLVKGDWVAQVYCPFRESQKNQLIDYWRSYKLVSARAAGALGDLNKATNISGFATKVVGSSISTLLHCLLQDKHPEFTKTPVEGQVIHFPEGEDYTFDWVGVVQGLRFDGTSEEPSDVVLLRYKGELIAVAPNKSILDLLVMQEYLLSLKLVSAKDFKGKWYVTFKPEMMSRQVWQGEYVFDDDGEWGEKLLPSTIDSQVELGDNGGTDVEVEFEEVKEDGVDDIPF